jgi:anti-sigma factor RsiW
MDETHCDRLDDYLTGKLSTYRQADFQKHLKGCQACRDAVDEWQRLSRTLAAATGRLESPSRAFLEQIETVLSARQDRKGEMLCNDGEA